MKYHLDKMQKNEEKVKYLAKAVAKIGKDNNFNKIAVMTSSKYDEIIDLVTDKLNEMCREMQFSGVKPVNMYADVLDELQNYDGVLLVEKYRYTKYKDFEKTLELLKSYNILIIGVITYR